MADDKPKRPQKPRSSSRPSSRGPSRPARGKPSGPSKRPPKSNRGQSSDTNASPRSAESERRRPPQGKPRPSSGPGSRPQGGRGVRGPSRDRDSERPQREPREDDLPWPDEIFDLELDADLRAELEAVGGTSGALVKHLLSVQVLAEDDPEMAYKHAHRLRERIPRSALARQTACIAAYRAGHFREAIKEEAAYRRTSSKLDLVPIAADSERGLQRPERALALVAEFEGQNLDSDTRTELLIVAGGAREDLADLDAARIFLQRAVRSAKSPMASARARFALGRLLVGTDPEQARKWLQSAVDVDAEGIWTDAAEILDEM